MAEPRIGEYVLTSHGAHGHYVGWGRAIWVTRDGLIVPSRMVEAIGFDTCTRPQPTNGEVFACYANRGRSLAGNRG